VNAEKFEVKQESTERTNTVYLHGELDLSTASQLRSAMEPVVNDAQKTLTINLKDLKYIDSTGMGVIISMLKTRDQINADLFIQDIPPKVKRLFDLTGITKFLTETKK
jgi:anti-sigma B factor antagonist